MEEGIRMDLKDVERGVDWIDLSRNGDKCSALVNTVMKVQFHRTQRTPWIVEKLLASQLVS